MTLTKKNKKLNYLSCRRHKSDRIQTSCQIQGNLLQDYLQKENIRISKARTQWEEMPGTFIKLDRGFNCSCGELQNSTQIKEQVKNQSLEHIGGFDA